MDILKKLNENLQAAQDAAVYTQEKFTITKVAVKYPRDLDITVSDDKKDIPVFVLKLKRSNGEEFVVRQFLKLNKDGKIRSPISGSYYFKDGTYGASTMAFDISNAIFMALPGDKREEYAKMDVWDDKKWVGQTFTMGLKHGEKDGKKWYMLETDSQKYYDTMATRYKAATGEWTTDKEELRTMDKGDYPEGVVRAETKSSAEKPAPQPVKDPEVMEDFAKDIATETPAKKSEGDDDLPF